MLVLNSPGTILLPVGAGAAVPLVEQLPGSAPALGRALLPEMHPGASGNKIQVLFGQRDR